MSPRWPFASFLLQQGHRLLEIGQPLFLLRGAAAGDFAHADDV